MNPRVSIFGLGKLGVPMAVCLAKSGIEVMGVDLSESVVASFNEGQSPVEETGVQELLASTSKLLFATTDAQKAVSETDISFIVVPTPSEQNGSFSLKHVIEVASGIGKALAYKPSYHLIALTSTVLPGSTEYGVLPVLEKESGKKCGEDFGLCYNPEFIALGSVITDFLNPDFLLIGESDTHAGDVLQETLKSVVLNDPPVQRMNFINAEMAKISLNAFVTTKITFANMLTEMSSKLPGADVDTITNAIGLDSRIGRRYLSGGLSYGGPCFPRDNRALGYVAAQFDCRSLIPESTDQFNQHHLDSLVEIVCSHTKPDGKVAVLGLSYKPHSDVVEESAGMYLAQKLAALGYEVSTFDPMAMAAAREILKDSVSYADSIINCVSGTNTVVVANSDPQFHSLKPSDMSNTQGPTTVVDCWRILRQALENDERILYVGLGIGGSSIGSESHLSQIWSPEPKP